MKKAKITAPTDYFVSCPYCDREYKTNVAQKVIKCECGNKFQCIYDRDYFLKIAESNIY